MRKKRLTYNRAVELLERAVQEKGADYAMPKDEDGDVVGCVYFDEETKEPSCLVGHALAYDGFTYEDLDHYNSNGRGITYVGPELYDRLAKRTLRLLVNAQDQQDNGGSWGYALEYAKEYAKEATKR
jgi:hypothetical protein